MSGAKQTLESQNSTVDGQVRQVQVNGREVGEGEPTPVATVRRAPRWLGHVAVVVLIALAVFGATRSAPYVVKSPGPTYDVLGEQNGTEIIQILDEDGNSLTANSASSSESSDSSGSPSSIGSTDGELRMVTVSEAGGPGYSVTYWEVFLAFFDDAKYVYTYESLYSDTVTAEEVSELGKAQMSSSQTSAQIAALEYLGYEVEGTTIIAGTQADTPADGLLLEGDILREITVDSVTYELAEVTMLYEVLAKTPVGTEVVVAVERDGELEEVTLETSENSSGGSQLGVYVTTEAQLPVDISISLERVGGSSAGMMFALGIIDKMTEGGIVSGVSIAGTGSLSYLGEVQAISGIVQKMHGALRDGAEYFLAPTANCSDVVGNIPDGLEVYSVSTLDEAVEAIQAISVGDASSLTACEAN